MHKESAFTLVELLVALAVAAVILTVAVPAFSRLATEQRVVTASNSLLAGFHLARAEAVRRGQRVTLCPSTDGDSCSPGVGYHAGWIVAVGPNAGQGLSGTGEVIRREGPLANGVTAVGNGSMANYISFVPTGQTRQLGGGLQMGRVTICNDAVGRSIIINRAGRPRVAEDACQ